MSQKISFTPSGVCCRQMILDLDGQTLCGVEFIGGCEGNLTGISHLVAGCNIDMIIEKLSGVDCHAKGTSCPDQLARALRTYKEQL